MDPNETQASPTAPDNMPSSPAADVVDEATTSAADTYQPHEAMDTADSPTTTNTTNAELSASAATSPSAIGDSANSPADENSCSVDGDNGGIGDGDVGDGDIDNDNGPQLHMEYDCVRELVQEFRYWMGDPANVEAATNYLYESLLDEMVLGVAFEVHYAHRTGILDALEGTPEDPTPFTLVRGPDVDVFGNSCTKIQMDCTCPKCDRAVAASRFATHLEKCMGMGRISSRIASRRLASTRDGGNSYFNGAQSDDEDDADWAGEKRKKKIQPVRTNGSKKNGKSSS